jgi:dihydroflavonol-4-reductase
MIFVTGGTGLVGAHLISMLVQAGEDVRAFRRKDSNMKLVELIMGNNFLSSKLEWVDGDVLDVYSLNEAMKGITHIYHAAAVISFQPSEADKMMQVNIEGTANVVNMALENKIKKLCYVSSIAAIGRTINGETVTEKTPWKTSPNNSKYAISKYGAEREVWRGTVEGLDAVIVNPSIIIGPGDWNSGSSKMFKQAYDGLKFYTSGINGFVDVRDVCKCMITLMNSEIKNERFIVNSENVPFRLLFDQICTAFGKRVPYIKASKWLGAITWRLEALRSFFTGSRPLITKETAKSANQCYYYSSEKIKERLNFKFIPISQSIQDTCAAFISRL